MHGRKGIDQASTLGAYVRGLLPGSACVCCGAALRRFESSGSRAMGKSRASQAESGILSCPVCGCEIAGLPADQAPTEVGQTFTRAA